MHDQGQVTYITLDDNTILRTIGWPSHSDSQGIIVLVNGHREYIEKYSEFISDFLIKGYAVYAFDNRGQGLSGRELDNRYKSYSENFDVFISDLDQVVKKVVMADQRANELPLFLVGHSMGGHVGLRYIHDYPNNSFDKAVLMAPMIDLNLGGRFATFIRKQIIKLAQMIGYGKSFAFGQEECLSRESRLIKQQLLTHDDKRYADEDKILDANPDLYVGGATFGWLKAALDSIDEIKSPGYADDISIPVLVTLAGEDQIVDSDEGRKLFAKNQNARIVTIEGARHEIYRESDKYRTQLWKEIDDFLAV